MSARSLSGLSDRDIADVLAGTSRVAGALRGARILVTGATGWFGTWLLDALVALDREHRLGLSIVAVSRDPAAFARRHPALHAAHAIRWFRSDVRDPLLAAPGPFTHVIHAATDSTDRGVSPSFDETFGTIVGGTSRVLDVAVRDRGARVLLIGSGAVYGAQSPSIARMPEDHRMPAESGDPYAEGKRAAERLAAVAHADHGVQVKLARCFAFVGPHMPFDAHFAIGNFIRDAALGSAIRMKSDGRPRRSYLYMSDLVVWLLVILVDGRPMRPYNVGGDEALSIAALARRVARLGGSSAPTSFGGEAGGRDYVADTSRITGELRVASAVPLDDAIRRTSAWFDTTRHRIVTQ